MNVRFNGQQVEDLHVVDLNTAQFTLTRPTMAQIDLKCNVEQISIGIVLSGGVTSDSVPVVLDTFNLIVLGDSIAWGQGLQENEKYSTLVARALSAKMGNIGVYKEVVAHSGAIIGGGPTDPGIHTPEGSALPGEVPTSYPTIIQQVDMVVTDSEAVDLVLLDGGINDVNIVEICNTLNLDLEQLDNKIRSACKDAMYTLLGLVLTKFPNARIVVTNYPTVVTPQTAVAPLELFLTVVGAIEHVPGRGKLRRRARHLHERPLDLRPPWRQHAGRWARRAGPRSLLRRGRRTHRSDDLHARVGGTSQSEGSCRIRARHRDRACGYRGGCRSRKGQGGVTATI
ncbi:MAG: SGNH/GDSL hydrolase family protein [Deltaproteobacteria bacterium]|nr:SGNH/GDSL hydrolase family protein [Deltaproteobacteria bacterium]